MRISLAAWPALLLTTAAATAFDGLVVFGDSLSDVGNVEQVTSSIPLVPTTPGPFYADGRFSNGPNYVDVLSAQLGLGPAVNSLSGGDVWAYGGALSSGTGFPTNLVVDDIDDQVDDFLGSTVAIDAETLFVVFAGGNDIAGSTTSGQVMAAAQSIASDIGRLYDAGGRSFLTPNLPDIGLTPRYNDNPSAKSALTVAFNGALDAALDDLELSRPGIELFRLDVFGLFNDLINDPFGYDLVNTTDEAAPGLSPGDSSYDTSMIVSNVDQYLFWDDFHPTQAGHALLAQAAFDVIPEPGTLVLALPVTLLMLRRRPVA